MKKTTKHILLTLLAIFSFTAIIFFTIFDRIETIEWGDKIILDQEVHSKYGQGSIWTGEFDHILECCPINNEYQISFNYRDSIGILIEVISEYEDYFDIPLSNHSYGRKGEVSMISTEIYEIRGNCLVQMANNRDEELEVGPPAIESYSDIGCGLLPTDWPVRSYIMQKNYATIVIERYQ
ncbi:MAG: hypothetical protein JXR11_06865 [Balneola sp.]